MKTAIPQLLATLALEGCIVTLDAMGTRNQHRSSHPGSGCRLRPGGQDNQPILADAMRDFFALFEAAPERRPIR